MSRCGDVILVGFPFSDGSGSKVRPALIVQNDRDNARLQDTVAAMITGNLAHAAEPTQVLADPSSSSGAGSGLHGPSVVKCSVLVTVLQSTILRRLGSFPSATMDEVNTALRVAMDL